MSNVAPLKDAALEEYFQALFEMYGTDGWRKVQEDVGRMIEVHDRVRGLAAEDVRFRQGQIDVLDWIITHQARSEQAYVSLLEDEQDSPVEQPTGGVAKVVGPVVP